MSSSRSIAAARARRAGEQGPPPPPQNRPVHSVNSHAAFAPQPTNQGKNVRIATSQQVQPPQSHPNQYAPKNPKLSISDAIGLITLRLGRVESIIMEIEHNGGMHSDHTLSVGENTSNIDISVINNIVSRLDSLEKNMKEVSQIAKEITDIKITLSSLVLKQASFEHNVNNKFEDINNSFMDIDKKFASENTTTYIESNDEPNIEYTISENNEDNEDNEDKS